MTLLIGSEGRIGKRYKCILRFLEEPYTPVDKGTTWRDILHMAHGSQRIILATPTDMHYEQLKTLLPLNKRILCEKPVTRNIYEMEDIADQVQRNRYDFQMVMQYAEIMHSERPGQLSWYNYFNHGPDGIYWDCMQVIGLAKGRITLSERSPIWSCGINGEEIKLQSMDYSYINMIRKWIKGQNSQNIVDILKIHRKVTDLINANLEHE